MGLDLSLPDPQLALRRDRDRGHARACSSRATTRPPRSRRSACCSQMRRIDRIIAARRRRPRRSTGGWPACAACRARPWTTARTRGTHHLYQLQIDPDVVGANVQDLKRKLTERGVTQIPHFAPLYKFQLMRQLGYDTAAIEASCPVCEDVFTNRFTHLPIYGLTRAAGEVPGRCGDRKRRRVAPWADESSGMDFSRFVQG